MYIITHQLLKAFKKNKGSSVQLCAFQSVMNRNRKNKTTPVTIFL